MFEGWGRVEILGLGEVTFAGGSVSYYMSFFVCKITNRTLALNLLKAESFESLPLLHLPTLTDITYTV